MLSQEPTQHRAIVALVRASDSDRELDVAEVPEADIDGVLQSITEDEESGGQDCPTFQRPTRGQERVWTATHEIAVCSAESRRSFALPSSSALRQSRLPGI